jgi:hypothetical protein
MYKVFFIGNATSVLDPNSFDTETDQAFYAEYRSGPRFLMSKNWKKCTAEFFLA